MSVLERIQKIGEKWFLTEPLLFAAYCSHNIVENRSISVPMRIGKRQIEIAPEVLGNVGDSVLEEFLKIEMFRILLKHPYQRQPPFASKELLTKASNATIADVYNVPKIIRCTMSGTEQQLPHGLCFEEYYSLLKEDSTQSISLSGSSTGEGDEGNGSGGGSSGQNDDNNGLQSRNAQISELWEEDEEACCDINGIIEIAKESENWGSVSGKLQGLIIASLKVDMDYRKIISLFKTSVISSKRHLTRMRPNRRFGFDAMGSRYELSTNLLIAIDVSGSISDKSLAFFFSVINRLFKYGVQKLDVLQFDFEIKGDPEPFKKARKKIEIMGRGGTNFQGAADYYCKHPEYDGLIYFTDGNAPPPTYNTKRAIDVLWVLCGKSAYEANSEWIKKIRRNRVTYIPRNKQ